MATTCKLIAKNVLGSDTSSVTFSSIPQTFDDLWLITSLRTDRANAGDGVKARFNGAANDSNTSTRFLIGDGSTATSVTSSIFWIGRASTSGNTASTFGNNECYIPNYASTTVNKSGSVSDAFETNASTAFMGVAAALWTSTNAITDIEILPTSGPNFVTGSSFYLYGVTHA